MYAIDCGGDGSSGTADERKQREDGRAVLDAVAEMTGGKSFAANNPVELKAAFQQIDQMERVPADSFRYRRYRSFGPWLAGVAAGVVLLLGLLERTWWRRLP